MDQNKGFLLVLYSKVFASTVVRDSLIWFFVEEIKAKRTLNNIFIVLVDIDRNAQYFPGDDYDLYESNYPLQEQKRLVKNYSLKTLFSVIKVET